MRRLGWTLVLAGVGMLAGCGGGGGGASPQATFETYKSAMADKNFEDVWSILSEASQYLLNEDAKRKSEEAAKSEGPGRSFIEKQAKMMDMTVDEMTKMDGKAYFVGLFRMAAKEGREEWEKLPRAQYAREERNGDRSRVYVQVDGQVEVQHPLPLVLEGGRWKIDVTSTDLGAGRPAPPAPPKETLPEKP